MPGLEAQESTTIAAGRLKLARSSLDPYPLLFVPAHRAPLLPTRDAAALPAELAVMIVRRFPHACRFLGRIIIIWPVEVVFADLNCRSDFPFGGGAAAETAAEVFTSCHQPQFSPGILSATAATSLGSVFPLRGNFRHQRRLLAQPRVPQHQRSPLPQRIMPSAASHRRCVALIPFARRCLIGQRRQIRLHCR